jgi:TetR/AcrR family transcriptional regulator, transcriptional repressor for nem operon
MARYSKEHRAETREAIVKAASELLRKKGFDGVGVADVMSAVGLTHGGFYAHFSDRHALLEEALVYALKQSPANFGRLASAAIAQNDPGMIADRYLADEKVAEVGKGCVTAALASELHRQPLSVASTFAEGSSATVAVLDTIPGLGGKNWAVLAMLVGAKAMMRAMPDGSRRELIRSDVAAAIRELARA